ncbi:MAG: hypothetical protein LUE65_02810 [Clostridiales bacterium]|nr:hypothetical protein [Clostridiales bacterium]
MKRRTIKVMLCAGLCAAAIAGGAMFAYADTTSTDTTEESRPEKPENDGSVMAKITAVGSSSITVVTADQPQGGGRRGEAPAEGETPPELPEGETMAEGETPPEKPEGEAPAEGETPPEKPEGEAPAEGETPPEKPEGETPAEGETPPERPEGETGEAGERHQMEMNFGTDTMTITIDSSTTITKNRGEETLSISDLSVDDVIRVVLDETTAVSIEVME